MEPAPFITIQVNLRRHPLWHPSVAEQYLDIPRLKLNELVEAGTLPWAWDFGTSRARKVVRILALSVVERSMGPIQGIGATKQLQLPDVLRLILPVSGQIIRSVELQRLFHSGPDLIRLLNEAGEIEKAEEARLETGVSLGFTRQSVADLLRKRRIL